MKLDKIWEIWEVSKKRWKKIWDLWEIWELWCQWTPCIYETLFRIHESKKPLSSIFHVTCLPLGKPWVNVEEIP